LNTHDSNAVFRLLSFGLVVIEHDEDRNHFMIVRPDSLKGAPFRGVSDVVNVGMSGTVVPTNAPPALLTRTEAGWNVDISDAAAPGPGPVWFNADFSTCAEAVEAIADCFFGSRVDNQNPTLLAFFGSGEDH
jgi:hypothetical protein